MIILIFILVISGSPGSPCCSTPSSPRSLAGELRQEPPPSASLSEDCIGCADDDPQRHDDEAHLDRAQLAGQLADAGLQLWDLVLQLLGACHLQPDISCSCTGRQMTIFYKGYVWHMWQMWHVRVICDTTWARVICDGETSVMCDICDMWKGHMVTCCSILEMLERATAALLLLNSLNADCWLLTWQLASHFLIQILILTVCCRVMISSCLFWTASSCSFLPWSRSSSYLNTGICFGSSENEWLKMTFTWSVSPPSASVSLLNFQWLPECHSDYDGSIYYSETVYIISVHRCIVKSCLIIWNKQNENSHLQKEIENPNGKDICLCHGHGSTISIAWSSQWRWWSRWSSWLSW